MDEEKEECRYRWIALTESAQRLKTYKGLFFCLYNSLCSEGLKRIPTFHQLFSLALPTFFCFLKQAYIHLQGMYVKENSGEVLRVCPAFAFGTHTLTHMRKA